PRRRAVRPKRRTRATPRGPPSPTIRPRRGRRAAPDDVPDATLILQEARDTMNPIAPVTGLIDKTEELIGHSPHTAIVSVPIGAWAVSNVCDGLALLSGDDRYDDAARISMAVGLLGAAGAV